MADWLVGSSPALPSSCHGCFWPVMPCWEGQVSWLGPNHLVWFPVPAFAWVLLALICLRAVGAPFVSHPSLSSGKRAPFSWQMSPQDVNPCPGEAGVLLSHSCQISTLALLYTKRYSLNVWVSGMKGLEPWMQELLAGLCCQSHCDSCWRWGCSGVLASCDVLEG